MGALRRLVQSRRERREQGRYVIEGPRLLDEALEAGVAVETVYCDVERRDRVGALLVRAEAAGAPVCPVAAGVLDRLGDARTSQGVTALAVAPALSADAPDAPPLPVQGNGRALVVVLVDVNDPGNLGTLLRSADAAAVAAVVVAGESADPLSPKVVRAAAGALFRARLIETADPFALLARWQLPAVGLVVRGGAPLDEADLSGPLALVLGGEARGIPDEVAERLAARVTIPMPGPAESLNVAMAGTVALFEALRQRRERARPSWGERASRAAGAPAPG
jgi:TrmH family RNA methyltransferase